MKSFLSLSTALVCLAPYGALAQDDPNLETISISALRTATPITEVGSSLSIITAQEIDDLGIDFFLDALTLSPGVTINQNGPFGGNASVRIRGSASGQTLVLIDGIPVNDPSAPSGGFNFANLDTENVERIEVLRGPQSTLWGTDAIGGVISVVTKRPEEGLGLNAFAEYGSFHTWRGGITGSFANEIGDLRLNATGITSDGISKADAANGNTEEDGFDNATLSARGGLNLPGDMRLEATLLYSDAEAETDSFSGGAQGSVADGRDRSETEQITANIALDAPLFDDRLNNRFVVGYSDTDRASINDAGSVFPNGGDRLILRYQGDFAIAEGHKLLFGAERDKSETTDDSASINGFFAVYEAQPIEGLTVSGGVRLDDHSDFGSETTFRAAAAYNPNDWLTLRGSWGEGFKAPSIFQTTFDCDFCPLADGPNMNLLPERSNAFDFGVELRSEDGRGNVSLTYFNQDIENQIDFDFSVGYNNIVEVDTSGIELSANYQVLDWLSVSGDYSLIDAEDGTGQRLVRVPKHTANFQIEVAPEGPFSGSVLVRHNSSERDRNGMVEGWTRVDLAAKYVFTDQFEVFGRIENLTDTQYQQILGYGTPGISGSLGVRIRL